MIQRKYQLKTPQLVTEDYHQSCEEVQLTFLYLIMKFYKVKDINYLMRQFHKEIIIILKMKVQ
jgi:hypothetical protein